MAFCRNCGEQIRDDAAICYKCGVPQQLTAVANDSGSLGWTALGCCVPIAGLVLWLVWKDTQPKNAKKAGLGALISVIAAAALLIVYFLIIVVLLATVLPNM